jgi:two-component system alkaline phosphatase synthesis response regulator PhoP
MGVGTDGHLTYNEIFLYPQRWEAYIGSCCLNLTRMEFNLLHFLMINKGNVLTYEQIYRLVWKDEYDGAAHGAIKNLVKRLRRKISSVHGEHDVIVNRHGIGYALPVNLG